MPCSFSNYRTRIQSSLSASTRNFRRLQTEACTASGPEFFDLRRDTHSWASLDAWITGGANLAGKTQPVRVTAAYLSGGLLETVGVAPVAGRLISQSDDVPGAQVVADISYGTWQTVFAGDPN